MSWDDIVNDGKPVAGKGDAGSLWDDIVNADLGLEPVNKEPDVAGYAGLAGAAESLPQLGKFAGGMVLGRNDWAADAAHKLQDIGRESQQGQVTRLEDIGTKDGVLTDTGRYIAYQAGAALPSIAASLLSGGVGGFAGKKLVEKGVANATQAQLQKGALGGMVAGAGATTVPMSAGEIGAKIFDETGEVRPVESLIGGSMAGALDMVGPVRALRGLGSTSIVPQQFMDSGSAVGHIAKEAGKAAGIEGVTEAGQELIGQGAAEVANPDADHFSFSDVANAAAAGAIGGTPFGAAGATRGAVDRARANSAARKAADGVGLSDIISSGEGGYGSFNRGNAGDSGGAEIDFSQMTVGQLMRRQALPKGDKNRVFAFGKYQVIPSTMRGAVRALGITPETKVTPELQEKIFSEYLVAGKRPQIKDYITGKSNNLKGAMIAGAREWASIADPRTGKSVYGGVGNNKASVSSRTFRAGLINARKAYQQAVKAGTDPEQAFLTAVGGGVVDSGQAEQKTNAQNASQVENAGQGTPEPSLQGYEDIAASVPDSRDSGLYEDFETDLPEYLDVGADGRGFVDGGSGDGSGVVGGVTLPEGRGSGAGRGSASAGVVASGDGVGVSGDESGRGGGALIRPSVLDRETGELVYPDAPVREDLSRVSPRVRSDFEASLDPDAGLVTEQEAVPPVDFGLRGRLAQANLVGAGDLGIDPDSGLLDSGQTEAVGAIDGYERFVPAVDEFVPTHELPDGTPVVAVPDEVDVWVDGDGVEYEDNNATPLAEAGADTARVSGPANPDDPPGTGARIVANQSAVDQPELGVLPAGDVVGGLSDDGAADGLGVGGVVDSEIPADVLRRITAMRKKITDINQTIEMAGGYPSERQIDAIQNIRAAIARIREAYPGIDQVLESAAKKRNAPENVVAGRVDVLKGILSRGEPLSHYKNLMRAGNSVQDALKKSGGFVGGFDASGNKTSKRGDVRFIEFVSQWRKGYENETKFYDIENDSVLDGIEVQENLNASSTARDLESDSQGAGAGNTPVSVPVQPSGVGGGSGDSGRRVDVGAGRDAGAGNDVVSDDRSAVEGARSDNSVDQQPAGGSADSATAGAAGGVERGRGGSAGDSGKSSVKSGGDRGAASGLSLAEKVKLQQAAETLPHVENDLDNIRATLPVLLPPQQEDVKFAEQRFSQPDGHGVLFTNGTGTGKTFTGLGVAKRFARQGKDNILIVVPSDKIARDWVSSGEYLGLSVAQLKNTKDNGSSGPVVTSYANFGNNPALLARDWDLVIADEAHKLNQNAQGATTNAQRMLNELSGKSANSPYSWRHYAPDLGDWMLLSDELIAAKKQYLLVNDDSRTEAQLDDWAKKQKPAHFSENFHALKTDPLPDEQADVFKGRADVLRAKAEARYEEGKDTPVKRGKVTFLSATPFAYHKSLGYADGYLFDASAGEDKKRQGGYNVAQGFDSFLQSKFGYRMRYGKLNKPDAEVDTTLAERNLNEEFKKSGVLSGRRLKVDVDYSREFVLIDDGIGKKIDEGMRWLWDQGEDYRGFADQFSKRFDYLARLQLLEAIKVKHAIRRADQHIKMGRKVVMFHSFKQGGAFAHPFKFKPSEAISPEAIARFEKARPDLVALPLSNLPKPIARIRAKYGKRAAFFNGDVPKAKRNEAVKDFNDDGGSVDVLLVQRDAGKEGISLHDTTGQHQRVLIDLGLPTKPTDAIQTEGRIYRTGVQTNAIVEYLTTGLDYENHAFGEAVARRSSTAENLALGHEGRNLLKAFVTAYTNASAGSPSAAQGVGGKDSDFEATEATQMDQAKLAYHARQQNNKRRDQREGKDYYATPEPVGLKMAEWLGLQPGEHGLEPSAGHGAIARWFPDHSKNTFIEPSYALAGDLGMLGAGTVKQEDFLGFRPARRFEGVAMNPPYGSGGSDAMKHLARAFEVTKEGGRVVALIPEGGSADKRFDKWYESAAANDAYVVANISLPTVTFKKAGTGVKTRIVVIDKVPKAWVKKGADIPQQRRLDFSSVDSVTELFDALEDVSMGARVSEPATENKSVETGDRPVRQPVSPKYVSPDDPALTWTGRGRMPRWVEEQIAAGKRLVDLAVPDDFKFSRRASGFPNSSVESVRGELTDKLKGRIRFLERSGRLVVHQRAADFPDVMERLIAPAFGRGRKVVVVPADSSVQAQDNRTVFDADQVSVDFVRRAIERGEQVVVKSDDAVAIDELQAVC